MAASKPHHCENGDRLWSKDTGSPWHPWHRVHGPAIERADGSKQWWIMDKQVAVEDSPARYERVVYDNYRNVLLDRPVQPIWTRFGPRPDNP